MSLPPPQPPLTLALALAVSTHAPLSTRLTNYLKTHNLSPQAIVATLSAMPLVELRAGIPVGHALQLPPLQTYLLAIVGNMLPTLPLLMLLRLSLVRRLTAPLLSRATKKAALISIASRRRALAWFVALPLPGTGAWTACFIAFVLGMRIRDALIAILGGVLVAGAIVTSLCLMGYLGAVLAAIALGGAAVTALFQAWRESHTQPNHPHNR